MKNVKLDYIFCFMRNLDVSNAVWVLYFVYKGMNLVQIGILEAIYHLSGMILRFLPVRQQICLAGSKL